MSSSGNILQVELTGFADRLDVRCKRKRRVKEDPRATSASGGMELP